MCLCVCCSRVKMNAVYRLTVILLLLVAIDSSILASITPSMPNYFAECYEELGPRYNYIHETSQQTYNRKCLTKCTYEKEGKLDSNGNFIISKFPTEISKAVGECIDRVQATDICKKVSLIDTCIIRNTNSFWKIYEECEKYTTYNDEFDVNRNYCYKRCQMIIDGNLDKNGKVNSTSIIIFRENPENIVSYEEALKNCSKIVTDENYCVRDLNIYNCVKFILSHWRPKNLEIEFECGKESNTYPFFGVQTLDIYRPCYNRCLMIKLGYLNENDIMKSDYLKKLYMNETQLEEAFKTCKMTTQETDKCIKDLNLFDCIRHIQNYDPVYLKKRLECAQETNGPLVPYRQEYNENYCKTRCLMIKENQLDINGLIRRNYLKQFYINDTIIDESIKECSNKKKTKTCFEDANAYYCTLSNINEKVLDLCQTDSKNYDAYFSSQCNKNCMMMHFGKLTQMAEIVLDQSKPLKKIIQIEEAIKSCKTKIRDDQS